MSNYTKTTDFEAKDSLPTGDSGKIIRGAEFETEFDAISTAIATKADTAGPTFTGTLTFETISDGTIGVTAFVDEDDMSSDSATLVPTQQSVKAYVDSQVTAQDLDFQADTGGALSIDLDSETLTFTGGTGVDTSGSGNAVTFAIDSTVATLTGTQTLTNKTLTSPDVNTPDIDGGTIDGTVIGGTTPAAVSATTVSATGNITVGGTVDGRDVATDGTKLDGIEAGATADQTAAEIRTLVESATDSNVFTDADHSKLDGIEAGATGDQTNAEIRAAVEAATDSNVFTDADHSKLDGIEALADVTDTTNVTAAGALMDSELTNITAVKALNQGVATTDTPTFAGLATSANVTFGDNDKAIFGAGSDLEIYHSTSHSIIADVGTGDLLLRGNNARLQNSDGSQTFVHGFNSGAVEISHSGNKKFETTTTGIDVTGTVTADGLAVDGTANVKSSGGKSTISIGDTAASTYAQLLLYGGATKYNWMAAAQYNANNGFEITPSTATEGVTFSNPALRIDFNRDISFFEDTGTTAKLFWDASAESLGIGTSSPDTPLHISTNVQAVAQLESTHANGSYAIWAVGGTKFGDVGSKKGISGTGNTTDFMVASRSTYPLVLGTGSTERMRLDSSGNVGIGTSSPASPLHVNVATNANFEVENASGTLRLSALNDARSANVPMQFASSSYNFLTGNVGIGTSSPSTKLHLGGTAPGDSIIRQDSTASGTNWEIGERAAGKWQIFEDDSDSIVATFMSSGNVGIGTDSPSDLMTIQSPASGGGNGITIKRNDNGTDQRVGAISFGNTVDSDLAQITVQTSSGNNGDGNLLFHTQPNGGSSTERMRIDSSGNVGINTTPSSWGGVFDTIDVGPYGSFSADTDTTFVTNNAYYNGTNWIYKNSNLAGRYRQQLGFHVWDTAASGTAGGTLTWSEAMRIDSNGNLLVGKTVSSLGTEGVTLGPNGQHYFTSEDETALKLNRLTTDGEIIQLRKNNGTVGSIGVAGSRVYISGPNASLHSGLIFTNDASQGIIAPSTNAGAVANGTTDLGYSGGRFKNGHFSGNINANTFTAVDGVYIGGVGFANKLDDYEEGTWTPAFTPTTGSFTTITTVSTGRYTKVGRLVTLFATIRTSGTLDVTGASGNLKITGLPFTCNSTIAGGGADLSHQGWDIGILNTRMYIEAGTNFIVMYDNAMNQSSFPSANIVVSDMSTSGGSFANLISFTASYEV